MSDKCEWCGTFGVHDCRPFMKLQNKYPGISPAIQGVFDTYERRIAEQEQTIAELREQLAKTKLSVSREFLNRSIAESRNIGWDSIQSLGWLELKRERDSALSELAAAQQLLKELHEFNECALCYDDGDCKFADAIDAARGAEAGSLHAKSETQGGESDAE